MSNAQIKSRRLVRGAALGIIVYGLLLLNACTTLTKPIGVEDRSTWSSMDPLTIPYAVRRAQFEKGNLVVNSSFEDGRVLDDQSGASFALKGWEVTGQHVGWIDQDALADSSGTVPEGTRCIKISRQTASETSPAEGVISDYIPVIPGNYAFTYHIRLKDIVNNRYRLGVKLFDAIAVKVLFYDRDKQPVDAQSMDPVSGKRIDNSDKSYSFSNYWRIDDFPWSMVGGRSYNYPFSEGDIPDQTRYVRLFFGLKGTGTLWLDKIHFGYSKWNFTALERFTPFFDQQLSVEQKLIPTPKQIKKRGLISYYRKGDAASFLPVIIVPDDPAPPERAAATILRDRIRGVLKHVDPTGNENISTIRILHGDLSSEDSRDSRLIFSIGKNRLYQRIQPEPPMAAIHDKQQGYIIDTGKTGDRQVVFLVGETPIGSYYAATTAIQLFEDDRCIYHNAAIVDYPDFLERSYVLKNWNNEDEMHRDLDALDRMSRHKLNKVYVGYNRRNKKWYRPGDIYRTGLRQAGRKIKADGLMSLAVMVNPYLHFNMGASVESLDTQLRYRWTHASPASFSMLKDAYRTGLDAGANTIMLLSDDFVPHCGANRQDYCLYTLEDKHRFVNLQNAHAFIINGLKSWLDKEYPGTRIEFCPPWYSNEHIDRSEGRAEIYFEELTFQIPRDVAIVWTGPTIRSLSIDMADLNRYRSLIGRWPMIWDNTLYARSLEVDRYGGYTSHYPGKVRMCNLFEPHDVDVPKNFQQFNHSRRIYTNSDAYGEIYKLKYATVADYEWNTAAYNPEKALWKILCKTYGRRLAQDLIAFSDAYYHLYGICSRMEAQEGLTRHIQNGEKALNDLHACLLRIARSLPDGQPLLAELERNHRKQKARFEKLSQVGIEPLPGEPSGADKGEQ